MKKFSKVLHLTHRDLDGLACKIISTVAFAMYDNGDEDNFRVVLCDNSGADVDAAIRGNIHYIGKDTLVLITDLAPTEDFLRAIIKDLPGQIRIIDHHKTNLFANEILDANYVDPGEPGKAIPCGVSLLYKYLLSNPDYIEINDRRFIPFETRSHRFYHGAVELDGDEDVSIVMKPKQRLFIEDFVNIARSWDVFEWATTGYRTPKMMQTLFTLLGEEEFVNTFIQRIHDAGRFSKKVEMLTSHEIRFIECSMKAEQEKMDAVTLSSVELTTFEGYKAAVYISTGGMNFSDMATRFLRKHPEIDLFIGIIPSRGEVSYRSIREDVDCCAIAKTRGGGGHPRASGNPAPGNAKQMLYKLFLPGLEITEPN